MIGLENVLKTSFEDVLKMSWRRFCKTFWRRFEDVLARCLEDVLKTSWRRLENVWPRWIYWSWSRHLEDVFWRRMSKVNIFVLIKTSLSRRMFAGRELPTAAVSYHVKIRENYWRHWFSPLTGRNVSWKIKIIIAFCGL